MNPQTRAEWRKTAVQGLYEYRAPGLPDSVRGVFYSRFSLGGKQTFRSLKTDNFEHAKMSHARKMADVEKDRQRGGTLSDEFKTLGALMTEIERRLAANPVAKNTTTNHVYGIARLRASWQQGSFETFPARNCTADVIAGLRDFMLTKAPWKHHFGRKFKHGYGVAVVNQTLWFLKIALDLATEKMVIVENPFRVSTVLRGTLMAKNARSARGGSDDEIMNLDAVPSRPDMMRILDEMRRLPDTNRDTPEKQKWLLLRAGEIADHAEAMAFSGMRRNEARASILADDFGDEFRIRGTKSKSSWRKIPVNPALRTVLDRIKARRIGEKTPLVTTAEPYGALRRACARLGLPLMRNHDLRHFFASACIASGVDIPTVSRWLGHADGGALAMKCYGHLLKDHSQAAAQKLNFSGAEAKRASA